MNGAESIATPTKTRSVPSHREQVSTVGAVREQPQHEQREAERGDESRDRRPEAGNRPGGSSAPSRTAAIGGTRVARSAGKKLAISVTMIPSASETTTVRASRRRPLFGSVNPTASNSQKRPFARPSPRKSPTIEASDAHHERLEQRPRAAPGAATRRACAASRTRACAARS